MAFFSTRLTLCPSRSKDLVRAPVVSAPHGMQLHHAIGSGFFQLHSAQNNDVPLVVTCRIPNLQFNPKLGGVVGRVSNSATMNAKSKPLFPAAPSVPVRFRCVISRCVVGPYPYLDVHCRSVQGQVIVDGASFVDLMPVGADGPETIVSDSLYQGPAFSQSELADVIIGRAAASSPLFEARQATSCPFDDVLNLGASSFSKLGHTPVHTINSDLASSLTELLASLGVDDDMAEFLDVTARRIQRQENRAWSQQMTRLFARPR